MLNKLLFDECRVNSVYRTKMKFSFLKMDGMVSSASISNAAVSEIDPWSDSILSKESAKRLVVIKLMNIIKYI